ncbi:hypothetical protein [Paenibacillus sp. SI8]
MLHRQKWKIQQTSRELGLKRRQSICQGVVS